MLGSSYSTVKAAIVAALGGVDALNTTTILSEPPIDPFNVLGEDGSGRAIWLADSEGDYDNVVLCGAGRLDLEETYDLTVVFQALPNDTDDTQIVTDERVDEMLGAFLLKMAADPTWGITSTSDLPLVYLHTTRGGFRRFIGPISDRNIRPAKCELTLSVECRISFDN